MKQSTEILSDILPWQRRSDLRGDAKTYIAQLVIGGDGAKSDELIVLHLD
jgi:hypothetical protein